MIKYNLLILALGFFIGNLQAGDFEAKSNYYIHCMGCHGEYGAGFPPDVPDITNRLPDFLTVEGGREFLVQVPGTAQALLSDEAVARLLNWMIINLNDKKFTGFRPYTADEVSSLRLKPLVDVAVVRQPLIKAISVKKSK